MKTQATLHRLFVACLLAAASAAAGAQDIATPAAAGAQRSTDALVAPAAANQQAHEIARGDPVRWYREDATSQQRWRSRQKEIGAALDEAKNACRQGPPPERANCLKAAQATWKEEMAAARAEAPVRAESQAR